MTISIIIPTLNAAGTLPKLLDRLMAQTVKPDEMLVVDSCSDDDTLTLAKAAGARTLTVGREDFDHGGTRDWALRQTAGDIVCFLTQDALPLYDTYLEALTKPLTDDRVACVCGRQTAKPDARPEEKLTRLYNYPVNSFTRTAADRERLGIKAFFLSDACSAYRRDAYLRAGGFAHPINTNEDMLIAARFLGEGYAIAYQADAVVEHSHTFTLKQDYQRSREIGRFLKERADALGGASADSEGMRYVAYVARGLLAQGRILALPRFLCHCAARWLGSRAGARIAKQRKP